MPRRIVKYRLANSETYSRSVIFDSEGEIAVILANLHGVETSDVTLNPPDDLPAVETPETVATDATQAAEPAAVEAQPEAAPALEATAVLESTPAVESAPVVEAPAVADVVAEPAIASEAPPAEPASGLPASDLPSLS